MRIGGGEARGRRLRPGKGAVRPTTSRVRSALFSMLGPDGARGLRVLDLYAGTGAFGIEALSRGAAKAVFVESDARRCREIAASVREFGYEARASVHNRDAVAAIRDLAGPFDLVFADPPYGQNPSLAVLGELDRNHMLADRALVVLEHQARLAPPDSLPGVQRVMTRKYGDTAVTVYRRQPEGQGADDGHPAHGPGPA